MARRRQHVQYSLDAGDIRALPENDIRMILRAADEGSEPEILYRKAKASEAAEIAGLVHKTVRKIYPRYYPGEVTEFFCMNHSKDRIRSDIQNGNVWVLLLDGQIIGTGAVEEGNHITRVYVLSEFQKKGYGTYIMNRLEERIAKEHETAVLDSSLPAFELYEKLGYQVIRREKMPLWNDVVLVYEVMEKKLR